MNWLIGIVMRGRATRSRTQRNKKINTTKTLPAVCQYLANISSARVDCHFWFLHIEIDGAIRHSVFYFHVPTWVCAAARNQGAWDISSQSNDTTFSTANSGHEWVAIIIFSAHCVVLLINVYFYILYIAFVLLCVGQQPYDNGTHNPRRYTQMDNMNIQYQ